MAEILSLQGRDVFNWACACVKDVLARLAERKGVLLDGSLGDWLAHDMLQRMDFPMIHGVAAQEEEALLAMGREANAALDGLVLARMWKLIAMFEGKDDSNDPAVRATARVIVDQFMDTLPKQGVARWPDPMQLVADNYAKVPRGPITATLEDGSVLTSYLLGWKPHRRSPRSSRTCRLRPWNSRR